MTDPPASTPPNRRRGGQPGNLNALKHGFYASRFRKAEVSALEASHFAGLAEEIALLRLYIRRVVELGAGVDNLAESLQLLRILCLAVGALTRLLKTHHLLSGDAGDEISLAIQQVYDELLLSQAPLPPHPPDRPPPTANS